MPTVAKHVPAAHSQYKSRGRFTRRLTILLCNIDGMLRLLETRTRDHHLLAADGKSSFDDSIQIIFMSLLAMIDSSKDRIGEIDANLQT